MELTQIELATTDADAADTLVIRRAPWWLALAEYLTGRLDTVTGHRWCQLIAGRAERTTIQHSRYLTIPITAVTAADVARFTDTKQAG